MDQHSSNVQNIKTHIDLQRNKQNNPEEIANYLLEQSKDRDIRRDIEAQKYIAKELLELGLIDDAEKLCKRLLKQRPNDDEIQALHMKIRNAHLDADSKVTIFEKNRRIINRIHSNLKHHIIGLDDLIKHLSYTVQKSLLNENNLLSYRDIMLLSSKPSQGVKKTIKRFFNQVYKYNLIEKEEVVIIDMAQYKSEGSNIVSSFLLDIYHAFKGEGQVTVFKNIEQCPQDLRLQMNQLVTYGSIKLDGRYSYQNGSLRKLEGMLISGSFDELVAQDQFIILHTNGPLQDALTIFTKTSQANITTQLVVDPLSEGECTQLFHRFFDEYTKMLDKNLGVDMTVDLQSFSDVSHTKFLEGGAIGLQALVHQVYQKINDYFIQHAEQVEKQWEIIYDIQGVCLRSEDIFIELFKLEEEDKGLQSIEKEINRLIGLEQVKQSLEELKVYLESQARRVEKGINAELISLHMLFKGNPGTGKTMIARLIAEYLKSVGYLSEGHLIEVDRSGLVGEYIGHTAVKTMGKVEAAMGGVLFVDEAYALARGGEKDFGNEAIDTLVKAMEDHKGKFVVIFAGYPNEMDDLLEMNPGLQSRISQHFYFEDYTSEQLLEIAELVAKSQGYVLDQAVKDALPEYFERHQIQGKVDNGNGRLARRTVEEAMKKQSVRTYKMDVTEAGLDTLILEDFGLEAKEVFDLEKALKPIIGLDHIKEMVRTLYRQEIINKKRKEMNPAFTHDQSLNFIFTGNPGTGKTTIARIVADLFKSIEVLKKGHLVEVSRSDLVGEYIGHTAIKTKKVFQKALGGVLFIDEAYALAQGSGNDFGKEAIDTLIKLIEDYRGTVSVVLAGYEGSMEEFLSMNEGLSSRFTSTLHFADYSPDELYAIALKIIEDKGFDLNYQGNEALKAYIFESCVNVDGNGRFIRNMVEELIRIQSDRIFLQDDPDLLTITELDIESYLSKSSL